MTQDEFIKDANFPLAARIAASILGFGIMHEAQSSKNEKLERQALEDQAARELEAEKMRPTIDGLTGKTAAALGELMARTSSGQELVELEKDAIGAALFGSILKGFGRGASALGKLGPTARLQAASGAVPSSALARAGQAMQTRGAAMGVPKPQGILPKMSLTTKGKLLAGGVGAAGLYGAYKGTEAARDFMMKPTNTARHWGTRRPLMTQVSQYGYPIY